MVVHVPVPVRVCQLAYDQEYAQAGTLHDRRQELDVLALQVKAADKDAQKRQGHVMAGDTAVASAREKLARGDVEVCDDTKHAWRGRGGHTGWCHCLC
jgi:hypothetical protein